ncbi:NAC domain-containing protein 83-like [Iris pallida]|uniref:NAC domain-containing protein 83-like n=1 Tax=Iris pallida TaxID=29817 RepID=A0AAX6IK53_IRIPA|nr:NAC domain-containing protein 83-like [Iris pallida]KAJ6853157.1 NAC domain-containing protein 83-like [Iris pallida]
MDRVLTLPPGFRFHPTDEELVVQYLTRKVFSHPLPASIIPEIHLGRHNPWDLLGVCEQERYFFNLREAKYANSSRSNRATGSGYWKATGKDKPVVSSRCNRVVGTKKVLVFYQGKAPGGQRTDWIMHEYHLASPNQLQMLLFDMQCGGGVAPTRDWVLCRIFKKQRATKMDVEFMNQQSDDVRRPSSPSGSDSSCVTGAGNGEDISSSP